MVASFYPLYEAAVRVGGDDVRVTNLTTPGVEPHDLELTPSQLDRIEDATLVLYVGGGFQPAVSRAAARIGDAGLDVRTRISMRPNDAHFWLDPTRMAAAVDEIAAALGRAVPAKRAVFRARAAAYRRELAAVDRSYRTGLSSCRRRVIVTAHDSFGYLAARYGLRQYSVSGAAPDVEPTPQRLTELAAIARRTGTTTVFTETLVSPRVGRTLAREAGVRTAVLDPIEGLTAADQRAGVGYADVMNRNLRALREALDCR